jgi:hypothetical protein
MKRREFLTAMGAVSALSIANSQSAFAAESTSIYVKGLIMVSFEDPQFLRLGLPKAPGHKGTLVVVPSSGTQRTLNIKGMGSVEAKAIGPANRTFVIPELIRMKEFYGDSIRSRISECPTVVRIPYTAIRSISAAELSPSKYAFTRADTGEEVASFRPRQIAESIKIDLSSDGVLKLDGGKTSIDLSNTKELRLDYGPEPSSVQSTADAFTAHFSHYFAYLDRPVTANYDVVPMKLGGSAAPASKTANSFFPPYAFCFLIAIP